MKKSLLVLSAVACVTIFACKSKTAETTVDSTAVDTAVVAEVDTAAVDTAAVDTAKAE